VRAFLFAYRRSGGSVKEICERYDLPESAEKAPEVDLPLATLQAITDEIAAKIGNPHLGVLLVNVLPRGSYGLLEFIARSSPTVREAARGVVRYTGLLNDLVTIAFEEHEDRALLSQRVSGVPMCVGVQCNELFVALIVRLVRELAGSEWFPPRVRFAHPAPVEQATLVECFGSHLEFDCGLNQVEIPAADLDRPVASSDRALLSTLIEQAELRLASRPVKTDELGRIREAVRAALRDGPPRLETIAASLKMSPRTLQRRLTDEATSFQDVIDDVREELARKYVAQPDRALGEIAYLLGFSELSAFARAFKRWTGQSPGQFRALAR
jgi:AraC-like DNA-binding protein